MNINLMYDFKEKYKKADANGYRIGSPRSAQSTTSKHYIFYYPTDNDDAYEKVKNICDNSLIKHVLFYQNNDVAFISQRVAKKSIFIVNLIMKRSDLISFHPLRMFNNEKDAIKLLELLKRQGTKIFYKEEDLFRFVKDFSKKNH
ncbi:hypothetical protein H5203_21590 [Pseudoalteromonas sp. SG41-1]|uniref:hypothetical protein n=1 Tax=Pseudoalteromonas sp. SG41-1 TaxID=2760979 RepID=UPI001602EE79|nr:hypothetical protein [Pseudoalteromonas sp. SG41-1]MBB1508039.1 hypothetical protein [Pseudoalteromonas sp. SG41-1]